jgi:hypothetical protein
MANSLLYRRIRDRLSQLQVDRQGYLQDRRMISLHQGSLLEERMLHHRNLQGLPGRQKKRPLRSHRGRRGRQKKPHLLNLQGIPLLEMPDPLHLEPQLGLHKSLHLLNLRQNEPKLQFASWTMTTSRASSCAASLPSSNSTHHTAIIVK